MPITQENDRVLLVCYRRSRQCERKSETEASETESSESVLIEASATKTQWLSNAESVTFDYAYLNSSMGWAFFFFFFFTRVPFIYFFFYWVTRLISWLLDVNSILSRVMLVCFFFPNWLRIIFHSSFHSSMGC